MHDALEPGLLTRDQRLPRSAIGDVDLNSDNTPLCSSLVNSEDVFLVLLACKVRSRCSVKVSYDSATCIYDERSLAHCCAKKHLHLHLDHDLHHAFSFPKIDVYNA